MSAPRELLGKDMLGFWVLGLGFVYAYLLCEEPEALSWPGTACASSSLVGRRLRDGSDKERLDADAGVVHL